MSRTPTAVFYIPIDRRRFLKSMAATTAGFSLAGSLAEALTVTPQQTQGPFYPLADDIPLDSPLRPIGAANLGTPPTAS